MTGKHKETRRAQFNRKTNQSGSRIQALWHTPLNVTVRWLQVPLLAPESATWPLKISAAIPRSLEKKKIVLGRQRKFRNWPETATCRCWPDHLSSPSPPAPAQPAPPGAPKTKVKSPVTSHQFQWPLAGFRSSSDILLATCRTDRDLSAKTTSDYAFFWVPQKKQQIGLVSCFPLIVRAALLMKVRRDLENFEDWGENCEE